MNLYIFNIPLQKVQLFALLLRLFQNNRKLFLIQQRKCSVWTIFQTEEKIVENTA